MASGDLARRRVEGVAQLREEHGDRAAAEGPEEAADVQREGGRGERTPHAAAGVMPRISRHARSPARRRRAVAALPRVLRPPQDDHRRQGDAGQRAARRGQPRAAGGRAPRRRARWCCASARRPRTTASSSTRPTTPTASTCPTSSCPSGTTRPAFFGAFNWTVLRHETLEADDLLGGLAQVEADAGGQALLFTGDRDMFQCVSDAVTVLWPAGKGETEPIGPAEVRTALRRAPRPGARLHRPARRSVRRAAGRQGHRREDRPRAAAPSTAASTRCSRCPSACARGSRQSLDRPGRRAARVPRDRHAAAHGRRAPARRADRLRRRGRGRARALDEPACGAT